MRHYVHGHWVTSPLGFETNVSEDVKNYICNIERVKKTYDHVEGMFEHHSSQGAPGTYLVFKRWDTLEEQDNPQVVFFFANPDVIAGLHTLANLDSMTAHGVMAPSASGCDSIVGFSMSELKSEEPKAVLGALDPSFVPVSSRTSLLSLPLGPNF